MPRRRIQSLDAKKIGTGRFTDQERDWLSQATTKELAGVLALELASTLDIQQLTLEVESPRKRSFPLYHVLVRLFAVNKLFM